MSGLTFLCNLVTRQTLFYIYSCHHVARVKQMKNRLNMLFKTMSTQVRTPKLATKALYSVFLSSQLGEGKICSPLTSLSSKCLSPFKHNWVLRRVRSSPSLNTEITNPANKLRTASEIQDQVYTQLRRRRRRRRKRRKRELFNCFRQFTHYSFMNMRFHCRRFCSLEDTFAATPQKHGLGFQQAPELL